MSYSILLFIVKLAQQLVRIRITYALIAIAGIHMFKFFQQIEEPPKKFHRSKYSLQTVCFFS